DTAWGRISALGGISAGTGMSAVTGMSDTGGISDWGCGRLCLTSMQNAKDDRDEHERRDRRKDQAADDGAAERGVLLAAFAETERHRRHADDHGERGHEHGAETNEAGL